METVRVTTWNQLKRLLVLVEEFYNMTDIYDCTFPILAGEVARQFCNQTEYAYYILYDNDFNVDVGYENYRVDLSGVYKHLWVDVTYLKEQYRGKHMFQDYFLPLIYELGEAANVKTVRFKTPVPKMWEKMTSREIALEHIVVITNEKYKSENIK